MDAAILLKISATIQKSSCIQEWKNYCGNAEGTM